MRSIQKLGAAALMVGVTAIPSGAHDTSHCVEIDNDIARLQCFDNAVVEEGDVTTDEGGLEATPGEELTNWIRNEENDAISDRKNISFTALPTEPAWNRFGGQKNVFFQIRCNDNTTSIVLFFDDFQIADSVRLAIRLDDNTPSEASWGIATNRKAVGLWRGDQAIPFIKRLLGTSKITIRAFLDDGAETYVFKSGDIGAYAKEVSNACNWQLG